MAGFSPEPRAMHVRGFKDEGKICAAVIAWPAGRVSRGGGISSERMILLSYVPPRADPGVALAIGQGGFSAGG